MILQPDDQGRLSRPFAMVDGCFDPLHRGHVEYFRAARALGIPVFCNLAADDYIRRQKGRPPLLSQADRAAVVGDLRSIDYVTIATHGTAWALRHWQPSHYVKGADWRGRLPRDQVALCEELGITIVYADCALNSSTRILESFLENSRGHSRV